MTGDGIYDGPRLVQLIDGQMVFSDAEAWRHEKEAEAILRLPDQLRTEHMFDIERRRGPAASAALRKTMRDLQAAGQGG